MRVLIIRPPPAAPSGVELEWELFHLGQTYDLPASIASALIADGIARLEMRSEHNHDPVYSGEDRRSR